MLLENKMFRWTNSKVQQKQHHKTFPKLKNSIFWPKNSFSHFIKLIMCQIQENTLSSKRNYQFKSSSTSITCSYTWPQATQTHWKACRRARRTFRARSPRRWRRRAVGEVPNTAAAFGACQTLRPAPPAPPRWSRAASSSAPVPASPETPCRPQSRSFGGRDKQAVLWVWKRFFKGLIIDFLNYLEKDVNKHQPFLVEGCFLSRETWTVLRVYVKSCKLSGWGLEPTKTNFGLTDIGSFLV